MINILSIDVALGSVCSALFFAKYLGSDLSGVSLLVLALSVWVIYTVDHLKDAYKLHGEASSVRHRFHQTNFLTLRGTVIGVILLVLSLLYFLPSRVLYVGSGLSVVVVLYLLFHVYLPYAKEFIVALAYTAGVFVPSFNSHVDLPVLLLCGFFVVALMNLLLFSWFSEEEDRADGIISLATTIGEGATRKVFIVLFFLSSVILLVSRFHPAFLILTAMTSALLAIMIFHRYFKKRDRYRIGDMIFFMGLVYWCL